MSKKSLLILITILLMHAASGQYEVQGFIKDATGHPIEKAAIVVSNSFYSQSNEQGYFCFTNLPAEHHLILIHATDFRPQALNIDITTDTSFSITLQIDASALNKDQVIRFKNNINTQTKNKLVLSHEATDENEASRIYKVIERENNIFSTNTELNTLKPIINGFINSNVLVIKNGIEHSGQQWAYDYKVELDPQAQDQLIIKKRVPSLQYSSAAVGGLLAFTTFQTETLHSGDHTGHLRYFYQSVNNTNGVTSSYKAKVKDIVYKVNYTQLWHQDYEIPADSFSYIGTSSPIINNRLQNTAGNERNVQLSLGTQKKWGTTFVHVSNYQKELGLFTGASGLSTIEDINPSQTTNHLTITSTTSINIQKNKLTVDVGLQQNNRQDLKDPVANGFPSFNDRNAIDLRLRTLSSKIAYHNTIFKTWKATAGIQSQLKTNNRSGYDFNIPAYQDTRNAFYSIIERLIDSADTYLQFGIRLQHVALEADQTTLPFFENDSTIVGSYERSPTLQNNYFNYAFSSSFIKKITPTLIGDFGISKSFRAPQVPELTAFGVQASSYQFVKGTLNINPENGYHARAKLSYKKPYFLSSFKVSGSYFSNYIYLTPSNNLPTINIANEVFTLPLNGQLYEYTQANASLISGEWFTQYLFLNHFKATAGITSVWSYNHDRNTPLAFTPPTTFQFTLGYKRIRLTKWLQKIYARLHSRHVVQQRRVTANENTTAGYQLQDIIIGFDIGNYFDWLSFTIRANNIFNITYFNHLSTLRQLNLPEAGRNFTFSVAWKFHYHLHQ